MSAARQANIAGVFDDDMRRRIATAVDAARDKKGSNVIVLAVGDILAITDFFVIVSGANDRQVKAIVEEVEQRLGTREEVTPLRVEGANDRRWVLMDYGDFWVHVFQEETRAFYELERLWADAPRVEVPAADAATG